MAGSKNRVHKIKGRAKRDFLKGTKGRDLILGMSGNDSLMGLASNDTLNGGKGRDFLRGGKGNDLYIFDHLQDRIVEAAGQGIDTVRATVSYSLGASLENLVLRGAAALNGTGNELANTLKGNAGNNILDGKAGADTLIGGMGDDTYYVDDMNDIVIEAVNGGTDKVITTVSSYNKPSNVEFIEYVGTGSFNFVTNNGQPITNNSVTIIGGSGNDTMQGGSNADKFTGGAGDDLINGDLAA